MSRTPSHRSPSQVRSRREEPAPTEEPSEIPSIRPRTVPRAVRAAGSGERDRSHRGSGSCWRSPRSWWRCSWLGWPPVAVRLGLAFPSPRRELPGVGVARPGSGGAGDGNSGDDVIGSVERRRVIDRSTGHGREPARGDRHDGTGPVGDPRCFGLARRPAIRRAAPAFRRRRGPGVTGARDADTPRTDRGLQ